MGLSEKNSRSLQIPNRNGSNLKLQTNRFHKVLNLETDHQTSPRNLMVFFFTRKKNTGRNLGNRWMVFPGLELHQFLFFSSGAAPSGSKLDMFQMILVQISNYKLTTGGFLKSVSKNHRKPQGPNGNEFHLRKLSTFRTRGNSGLVDPEGSHIRR